MQCRAGGLVPPAVNQLSGTVKAMLDGTETDGENAGSVRDGTSRRSIRSARSEIAFPYIALEDAISVARIVADGGGDLTRDQVSAKMGAPLSTFNVRVAAARTFGLLRAESGNLRLTGTGRRIMATDLTIAATARRDAFFCVELYRKTFHEFKGRNLPDEEDLEDAFRGFGVAPKQADKARLAFERSALFAGFFHAGRGRLVEPIIAGSEFSTGAAVQDDALHPAHAADTGMGKPKPIAAEQHLIVGLLERLPPPDTAWSIEERARWLRALSVNLSILYGVEGDGEISIITPSTQVTRESTKASNTGPANLIAPMVTVEPEPPIVLSRWDRPSSAVDD